MSAGAPVLHLAEVRRRLSPCRTARLPVRSAPGHLVNPETHWPITRKRTRILTTSTTRDQIDLTLVASPQSLVLNSASSLLEAIFAYYTSSLSLTAQNARRSNIVQGACRSGEPHEPGHHRQWLRLHLWRGRQGSRDWRHCERTHRGPDSKCFLHSPFPMFPAC